MIKVILLLFLTCTVAIADVKPRMFIFHINGVNTTEAGAIKNYRELLRIANIDSNVISWNYLYNPAHSNLAVDLEDVYRQKHQENKNLTIDDFVLAFMDAYNLHDLSTDEYNILKDAIKDSYAKDLDFVGSNFETIRNQFYDKTKNISSSIVKLIKSRQDLAQTVVLLVPHSQGNLYANQLRSFLISTGFPKDQIGIFGIANPADRIDSDVLPAPDTLIGGGNTKSGTLYITADNDLVINALRKFSFFSPRTNEPMPSTIHLNICNDFNLCHGLTESYLADPDSTLAISKKLKLFVLALEQQLLDKQNSLQLVYKNYSELIDLTDASMHTVCRGTNCDENIFGYISLDPDNSYNSPYLRKFLFSFPGKLTDKEYFVLQEQQIPNSYTRIEIWSNGLQVVNSYFWSPACEFLPDQVYECKAGIDKEEPNNYENQLYAFFEVDPYLQMNVCELYSNYCYKNHLILGSIILGTPRYSQNKLFDFSPTYLVNNQYNSAHPFTSTSSPQSPHT